MSCGKCKTLAKPGDKYGRFELLTLTEVNQYGQQWRVRCECGQESIKSLARLRYKASRDASHLQCPRCAQTSQAYRSSRRRSGCAALAAKCGDRHAFALLDGMEGDASEVNHDLNIERSLSARERR